MAQYSPSVEGLAIGDYTASYDRSVFFPVAESDLTIQSIEMYLDAGVSNRVAIYSAPLSTTIENATRLYDFGVVNNPGGSAAFITANTVGTITVPEGTYPVIVVRQGASIAICGDGAFPHGDAIAAYRSYNGEVAISTAFPNPAFDDDEASQSFRIPYARLNYTVAEMATIVSINSGQPIRAGQTGIPLVVSEGFTPTSGTISGRSVTNISGTSPNFTFDLPEVTDSTTHPFYGSGTSIFTDGVNSPEISTSYLPKEGYDYVTLSGSLDLTINGVVYEFSPPAQSGDQIAFPSPEVDINSDATGTATEDGTFELEHISSVDNTLRTFDLIIGNLEDDTTPDAFTFNPLNNVELSTLTESNTITITGVSPSINVSITITNGQYQINGGSWTSSSGNVQLNDQVKVRLTSSASYSSQVSATLTVGGVNGVFSVTTKIEPPIMSDSTINLAGGPASKLSVANLVNSRAKLPFIADSTAESSAEFVTDLNELLAVMRTANWFEEEPE